MSSIKSVIKNVAGIYRITENNTGMIYIGETNNIRRRFNEYANLREIRSKLNLENTNLGRPIEAAIHKKGFRNFTFDVICTEDEDPDLRKESYRKAIESYYIKRLQSNNPSIGYNYPGSYRSILDLYKQTIHEDRKPSFHNLHKAIPVILYDIDDDSTMMFLSISSCAKHLNKDRGIIGRCIKTGISTDHYLMFTLDPEYRMIYAIDSIARKIGATGSYSMISKGGHELALRYIHGLQRCNEWCEQWGYTPISISDIHTTIKNKFYVDKVHLDYLFTSFK